MKGSGSLGERKQDTHTETDKFRPIPVAKLVVHCVAPVPWSLILRRSPSLEAKPCPLWAFHVAPPNTRFVVQREVGPTILLVCSQVKLRNDASNDLII